jgi:hypothetical protein
MKVPRWQRAYAIATCALIGAAFAYAACDWAHWPRLTLLPLSGAWTTSPPPNAIAISYLGTVLWGAGGLAAGALAGAGLCRIARAPLSDRMLLLLGAWAISANLLVGAYYTWSVWPW